MPRMTMTAARRELSEAVNKLVYGKGEPIVLSRRGKDLAAIIPLEEFKLLEEVENRILLEEIRKAKKARKGTGITLEQLRRKYKS